MNLFNHDIPRGQLTLESTKELRTTMDRVITEILQYSCPCHYPRFRHLVNFQHNNYNAGPVFCADTNYLVGAACHHTEYLVLTSRIIDNVIGDYSADLVYTCQKCGTIYKNIAKQYSINFEFEYLITLESKYQLNVGADVIFPIPLLQGLFGFHDSEILKCAKEFKLGNVYDVFSYLTEKK